MILWCMFHKTLATGVRPYWLIHWPFFHTALPILMWQFKPSSHPLWTPRWALYLTSQSSVFFLKKSVYSYQATDTKISVYVHRATKGWYTLQDIWTNFCSDLPVTIVASKGPIVGGQCVWLSCGAGCVMNDFVWSNPLGRPRSERL